LPRFDSPFVKEIFEGIYFSNFNSHKTSVDNGFSYDKIGMVNLN